MVFPLIMYLLFVQSVIKKQEIYGVRRQKQVLRTTYLITLCNEFFLNKILWMKFVIFNLIFQERSPSPVSFPVVTGDSPTVPTARSTAMSTPATSHTSASSGAATRATLTPAPSGSTWKPMETCLHFRMVTSPTTKASDQKVSRARP